jgi:hypothetical protein
VGLSVLTRLIVRSGVKKRLAMSVITSADTPKRTESGQIISPSTTTVSLPRGCQAPPPGGKIEGGSVLSPYTRQRELRKPTVVMTPTGEESGSAGFLIRFCVERRETKSSLYRSLG